MTIGAKDKVLFSDEKTQPIGPQGTADYSLINVKAAIVIAGFLLLVARLRNPLVLP